MKLGLLLFPSVRGSAQLARMVEGMGFDSLVFADTQNITPEVWGQLMLAARDTERIALPRFERLKALGLDSCRVVPGSRDAPPEVTRASLATLTTVVKPAVA